MASLTSRFCTPSSQKPPMFYHKSGVSGHEFNVLVAHDDVQITHGIESGIPDYEPHTLSPGQ